MTHVLTPDIVGACDIDVDIVPLPRSCASSFLDCNLYFLVEDAESERRLFFNCVCL